MQVLREAGARVVPNLALSELNIFRTPQYTKKGTLKKGKEPRIEIAAFGLELFSGLPLLCDATLVSPLAGDGKPKYDSAKTPGAALAKARQRKEKQYPELVGSSVARLVVLASEVGGRMSDEAEMFLRMLAKERAKRAPRLLRASTEFAFYFRWTALVACAAQVPFSESLLDTFHIEPARPGACPAEEEILADTRYVEDTPGFSRLPSR